LSVNCPVSWPSLEDALNCLRRPLRRYEGQALTGAGHGHEKFTGVPFPSSGLLIIAKSGQIGIRQEILYPYL
jgi:hypothetical protein